MSARKVKEPRTPKRIVRVVERCRASGYLLKTMPTASFGESAPKWQFADGVEAPEISVTQAISRGVSRPRNDGLFGSDTSQTWVAA